MANEQYNGLRQKIERMALEWKAKSYLHRFADRETYKIGNTKITAWTPRGISPEFDYKEAYETAVKRSNEIFGLELPHIEFVRVTTTEQYNTYRKMFDPQAATKKKGDGFEGSSIEDKIVLVDYSALSTETSLLADHGSDDKDVRTNHQRIMEHELGHTFTRRIIGNNTIHSWYYDAIGILVGPQKQKDPEAARENLKKRLKDLNGRFPTVEDLWKPIEGKRIIYDFAMEFMRWIFQEKTATTIPYTTNDIPEENRYEIKRIQIATQVLHEVRKGVPFEEAFAQVFGFESHQSAYEEFYKDLMN